MARIRSIPKDGRRLARRSQQRGLQAHAPSRASVAEKDPLTTTSSLVHSGVTAPFAVRATEATQQRHRTRVFHGAANHTTNPQAGLVQVAANSPAPERHSGPLLQEQSSPSHSTTELQMISLGRRLENGWHSCIDTSGTW